ncbi:hypothetical protein [Candidatus Uabimicrobium amorphum]|uniref:Uncharacterized protein n=1 Tax=Uabimicrobium amorphum TaxID=2596890 RepID=A0A5S9IL18_UABAM|nr:hypothetical protein [Candidatus Uabimicrobium amorphum]BBM83664.1 hypothetical protein UABAM_02017 [Candidatus Uabimicrobium amorphum]
MWKIVLVCAVVFCACNNKTQITPNDTDDNFLLKARESYSKKQFTQSASLFVKAQKVKQQSEISEAQLGEILCLVAVDGAFQEKIDAWDVGRLYYWKGYSLDPFAEIPASYQQKFRDVGNHKLFHVLDLLLETGHDKSIQSFLQVYSQSNLQTFIVAKAWYALENNSYDEAKRLFSLVNDDKQHRLIRQSGTLLTKVLLKKQVTSSDLKDIIKNKYFFIANKKIELEVNEQSVVGNMLFHFGVMAKHSIPIWEQGKTFIAQNANDMSQEAHDDYLQLFSLATAWKLFTKGDLTSAKQNFQKIVANKKKLSRYCEAHLGLAVILWMEEEDYEEVHSHFTWLNKYSYWLGGKSISLFIEKRRPQKAWQKVLQKNSEHKVYLVLLDTLCRLGEGRSAYALLGTLMSDFEDADLISLYEKEDKNIPKDVYAENKIWEKID